MKKISIAIALLALSLALSAQIPPRIVEFGVDVDAGASNNYFLFTDFFPADGVLLLDLDSIAQGVAWNGLCLSADGGAGVFLNVRLPKKLDVGVFAGVDAYAWGSLPASLFQFLAEGNAPDETITGEFGLRGDVFAEIGAKASLGWGPWTFRLSPAFFGTAVHVGRPNVIFSLNTNTTEGTATATVGDGNDPLDDGSIPIYSVVPYADLQGEIDPMAVINAVLAAGGVDLTLGADYLLLPGLTLGATLKHLPIAPSRLRYENLVEGHASATIDNVLNAVGTNNELYTTTQNFSVTTTEGNTNVFRPFKGGFSAVWVPRGLDFLSVSGNLDFVGYEGFYVDFGAKAQATLKNILTGYYSLSFEDLIWKNRLGFAVNLRVFELNGIVSLQSADFFDSFTSRGLYAALGLRFGF